jgi:plastocyanin
MKTSNSKAKNHRFFTLTLVGLFFLFVGCSKANDPSLNQITIQNMAFSPATLTVTAGTTVTWTNKDAIAHSVTSDTGLFDSGSVSGNGTYSYTFSTVGTFAYHCSIHTTMKAQVIVTTATYVAPSGGGY